MNVVDTTAPTATVSYSTLATTSGSVIATLTGASEAITITNNGGLSTYTFANNGSFTFNFSDISGNTGSVTATVNNIDTTAPVITLVGSNPTTIAQGSVYVDAGATATDVVAGNLTSSITSSGTVNTSIIGSYSVTYTVSDTAGNTATAVRTVNVIVATPITTTGGGGGGGGSSSYGVSSSPNSTSSSNSSSSANSSMSLGLAALQRILNNSINSSEQSSETSHSNTTTDIIVSDIDTSYAKEEITILIEKGYVRNAEKFDPTRKMTRGEFIKILSLANDFVEMDDTEIQFKDVATGSDFEKYIKFGVAMGWVNPNQEKFRPNDAITLGEVMKLLNAVNGTGNAQSSVSTSETITREEGAMLLVKELGII